MTVGELRKLLAPLDEREGVYIEVPVKDKPGWFDAHHVVHFVRHQEACSLVAGPAEEEEDEAHE
jgi:hypothetical protein